MNKINIFLAFIFISSCSRIYAQNTEQLNLKNQSLSYQQAIEIYTALDKKYEQAQLFTEGLTDAGIPLHLFIISPDKNFDPASLKKEGKIIYLINNGIHAGEPDGIDACVRFSEQLLAGKISLPKNVVIGIIPVYNIEGALKRGCCSRPNQNGPELYGFRGNGQNLDLNRDFIKCDSENAKSFTEIFRKWDPDIFVDTHVSDGADYQYTMTLIPTQHNKLGGSAGTFMDSLMVPGLFRMMKASGVEMTPYVNTRNYDDSPLNGIYGYLETPRYGSGYAALFNCLSFVTETHMLKPFPDRVEATLVLLQNILKYASDNSEAILKVRKDSNAAIKMQTDFPIKWELDSSKYLTIPFKGYEASYSISPVTGQQQLHYDRNKPYTKEIKYYDTFSPSLTVQKPAYYIIPQAWKHIINRMKRNKVIIGQLEKDTVLEVTSYVISDFKSGKNPYEGHYLHTDVTIKTETKKISYLKGDYFIAVNQDCNKYIVETLEPQAPDSWFAWGFFDSMLQQKEGFSAYVFDEMAVHILADDPELNEKFQAKKTADVDFASNNFEQLNYIFKNSKYYEDYRRYPVARFNGKL